MSKQRPILFKTEMVQAILENRKTQTRRIIKPQPDTSDGRPLEVWHGWPSLAKSGAEYHNITPPFGKPGDVLWVKETYSTFHGEFVYRADIDSSQEAQQAARSMFGGWKPSLFMPREAARLFLEITAVRAERLQDISHEDAKAEGVYPMPHRDEKSGFQDSFIDSYRNLWQRINGPSGHTWQSNPWVWIISFKRIEQP